MRTMHQGTLSEVGPIRRILLRHPRDAFANDARIDAQWRKLNFTGRPDLSGAIAEYDRLVDLVTADGD